MPSSRDPQPEGRTRVDGLTVLVFATRAAAGRAAAARLAAGLRAEPADEIPMVFASAPSQDEVLEALAAEPDLPWDRVLAFHLDEYVGLPGDAPQAFGRYLRERLFDRVRPARVHYLDGAAAPDAERERYASLLRRHAPALACIGIGENGHIAFNEPGAAFDDASAVRIVALDDASRRQQVHDGCFAALSDVPRRALTMTIPAIMAARTIVCVVPGARKARAVQRTLQGTIDPECPATALRLHSDATLYLDRDSAALVRAPNDGDGPR